jgi:hypothetical protein
MRLGTERGRSMKRFFALILICLFAASAISAGDIRAPRGFVGRMYASTLALYGYKQGATQFLCTAEPFEKISGGYTLISAGHCVQDVPEDVQFFVADSIGGVLTPVKVLKAYEGDGTDFSEFELKTKQKYALFVLGDEHDARVGDQVINPNFAAGLAKQLSVGQIGSDLLPISDECATTTCAGDFIVHANGAGGSSGSAVVDVRTQQVVGIVVWGFNGILGLGVEPISNFYKFQVGPNQAHPAAEPQ